jgi:hypothetical protein
MNNLKFYSEKNLQLLRDNIDNLEQEATKKGYIVLDPKNEEYKQVNTIILEYIIEKKRIIYGGTAYHKIIQHYRKDKDNDKIQFSNINFAEPKNSILNYVYRF